MKKQVIGFLLASTLAIVAAGCTTTHHSAAWTYTVVYVDGNQSVRTSSGNYVPQADDTINSMTSQGWEFVSLSVADSGSAAPHPNKVAIVFKRYK
jgi:hypothetical protein